MSKQLKVIPKFMNVVEEQTFWEKHDSTDYVDWTKAQRVVLPNLKPTTKTISLRLPQHLTFSCYSPFWRARHIRLCFKS
jgi:hypothetical protein